MINKIKDKTYNLLRLAEKITKTDMVYLAKGGGWLTLGKSVGALIGFFLAIIYAHFLPKEEYATYKYLLSVSGIFAIITLPGLETSMIRSIAKGYEGSYKEGLKARFVWSSFGFLLAAVASVYYFLNHNKPMALGLLIIGATTPFINGFSPVPLLQGKKLWSTSASLNIIKSSFIFVAIGLASYFYSYAPIILLANFLSTAVFQMLYYKYLTSKYKLNEERDEKCVSLGKHLSAMSALGIVADNIDKILVWKFLGATDLAVYSFATIPINQSRDFLRSFSILAFPKIVQQDIKVLRKSFLPKIFRFSLILVLPVAVYIVLAPFFFKVLFPQYMSSVPYSQIYALILILFPQRLISQVLISESKTKFLYFLQIFEPSIRILLYLLLIPMLRINGAVFAIIITSLLVLLFQIYFFKRN